MIKNFIFDFGKVMVEFEPDYMVGRYVTDKDDARILADVVFDRLYWDKLDAGTVSDAEVIEECKKRIPKRLWDALEKIYYNWIYNIPEIEGMSKLVSRIKTEFGAPVFLLSNISTYFAEHKDEIDCLSLFDKLFFSSVCGMVKPNADIFLYVCRECGIKPEETLFVDDSPKNIAGAEAVGIRGYLFDGDAKKLERYVEGLF